MTATGDGNLVALHEHAILASAVVISARDHDFQLQFAEAIEASLRFRPSVSSLKSILAP
jgi:hypothetical protein